MTQLPDVQSSGIIPGPQPGLLWVPSLGKYIDAKTWTKQIIYDTEQIVTPVPAGNRAVFFRSLSFPNGVRKDRRYTNMVTVSQLPSGWHAIVQLISVRVLLMETAAGSGLFTTAADVQRLLTQGCVTFTIANQKVEAQGTVMMFPSPYGMSGPIVRTGAAATVFEGINNGVPALSAVPPWDITIELTNELTFEAEIEFPGALTLDNDTFMKVELHTTMSKPIV